MKVIALDKDTEDITHLTSEIVSSGRQKLERSYEIKKTEKKDERKPQKDSAGKTFKSTKDETQIKQKRIADNCNRTVCNHR